MTNSAGRTPRVSITMPVLNGERYISESIESILAQTFQDFELIVVDDGSTDRTAEIVRGFASRAQIKIVHHPQRQGIARSVNDGVRRSSGELIAFCDHDDAWLPNFLESQVSYLDEHADVGMVHSDFQMTDGDGNVIVPSVAATRGSHARPSGHVFPQLFMDSFIVGNSVMIRKEIFETLGGFDESLRFGDYLLWMRIARHYKVDYVPKALTQYRQHAVQSTRSLPPADPDQASVGIQAIKKILELYPEARGELGDRMIRRRLATLYFDVAYRWFSERELRTTRMCLRKAIRHWPTHLRYYLFFASTLVPANLLSRARKLRRRISAGGPGEGRSAEQTHAAATAPRSAS